MDTENSNSTPQSERDKLNDLLDKLNDQLDEFSQRQQECEPKNTHHSHKGFWRGFFRHILFWKKSESTEKTDDNPDDKHDLDLGKSTCYWIGM